MGLFDFVKNALTPPGTSERNRDSSRKGYPQRIAGNLLAGYEPLLTKGLDLYASNFPNFARSYNDMATMGSPLKIQARVDATRQKLLSDAQEQTAQLKAKYAGTGAIGLQEGLDVAGANEANRKANELQTYYATPEGIAELSSYALTLFRQGVPGSEVLATLNAIIQGRQPPPVGADPLTSIGNVASLFTNPSQVPILMSGAGGGTGSDASGGLLPGQVSVRR